MRITSMIAVTGALVAAQPAFAAEFILNGSFEDPFIAAGSYQTDPTHIDIPNWSGSNVDVVSNGFAGSTGTAFDGTQFLDLVGLTPGGSISQVFNTIIGKTYTLTFAYSNNAFGGPTDRMAGFSVAGDNGAIYLADLVSHNTATPSNFNWSVYTNTFTATRNLSTLAFVGQGFGNAGVLLDAVSVSGVPEPTTWAMMILGIGLVGAAMRRRQQSVRYNFA